jgi:hypothetical protein
VANHVGSINSNTHKRRILRHGGLLSSKVRPSLVGSARIGQDATVLAVIAAEK